MNTMQPRMLGIILIVLILLHTLHLVRSNRLSAHLAISWIVTEVAFLLLCIFDWPLELARSFFGEGNTLIGAFLLGIAWMVFLMLDSLTRISTVTGKLKEVNQELALLRERVDKQQAETPRNA
jgi:hypothetical protein